MVHRLTVAMAARFTSKLLRWDVHKAFDCVWHKALLSKLENLRLRGQSYSGSKGCPTKCPIKMEQDHDRGPPRFHIGVPALHPVHKGRHRGSTIKLYTDGSLLMVSATTEENCANIMQPDFSRYLRWAKSHKITLNGLYPLYMDGEFIEEVMQHKHLKFALQRNGRWSAQQDT